MRESLQREVEENIQKAMVLKEAMKESSDQDAEAEQEEYNKINGIPTPNNRSNSSLNRQQLSQQDQQQNSLYQQGKQSNSAVNVAQDKRSRLDRIFGRKASTNSHAPTLRNQVTPHPHPQSSQSLNASPSLQPSNTLAVPVNGAAANRSVNGSAVDLNDLKYLPVDESEEEEVLDRSMSADNGAAPGTEVKLHPTRAKTFALPKSLRNLKRRIAALRAKGTDLDVEQKEREERERRSNGGVAGPGAGEEKKKFALIRLLPWRSSKKAAPVTMTTTTTATATV
ncbi:hypothetical protein BG011_003553 [Mortierella polycephala]|uniref:Uncharacterized protein n=1 Tax=Mortierella polycephala TaxID=41804 RepID=A0A9P6Q3T6_9FUNG|nr:hypothetical protein BG011_003553 [Mortierella polycephala]